MGAHGGSTNLLVGYGHSTATAAMVADRTVVARPGGAWHNAYRGRICANGTDATVPNAGGPYGGGGGHGGGNKNAAGGGDHNAAGRMPLGGYGAPGGASGGAYGQGGGASSTGGPNNMGFNAKYGNPGA